MSRKIVSFDFAMSSTEGEIHTNKLSEQRVYTNDTNSVELEFNITDVTPDYLPSVGANAMLYIYMADGSFFVKYAQHLKLDQNRFYYVLTPEEVKRSGMTKVQLIILIGEMEIASPLFDFKIVNGLVKYPIRPVEIRDWDALTTQARLFVEDLQDLTAEEFTELKMDEKLINLERDYAGRLQSTENQLKAKVDKGNVSVSDININLGKLDQRHISDELLAQIAGDAAVNAVPAPKSITADKLALDLTYDVNINLLNSKEIDKNNYGYYDFSSGDFVAGSYYSTPLIPVKPNTIYTKEAPPLTGNQITFWDVNGNYLSGIDIGRHTDKQRFVSPNNNKVAFVRYPLNGSNLDNQMFVEGDQLPNRKIAFGERALLIERDIKNLKTRTVNLVDKNTISTLGYFSWSGDFNYVGSFKTTDLIPVEENNWYSKSISSHITFYDENHNFVDGYDIGVLFKVPANKGIKYVRSSIPSSVNDFMIVKGFALPNRYIDYGDLSIELFSLGDIKDIKTVVESEQYRNVLALKNIETGYYHNYQTGDVTRNRASATTGEINVTQGEVFTRSKKSVGFNHATFWDGAGNYINGLDLGTSRSIRVPSDPNIKTMKLSLPIAAIDDNLMLLRGLGYPSYKYILDDQFKIPSQENIESNNLIKPFKKVTNPIITKEFVTDRSSVTGVADPFIVMDEGRYHIFFEVLGGLDTTTGLIRDEIGHAYSDNLIDWTYTKIVLSFSEHDHRSAYPHVFKIDGDWYMLPDVNGSIKLYKASSFPLEWEFVNDLVVGTFSDTNIFKVKEVWYMTTFGGKLGRTGTSLYYNTSGDFKNDQWQLHPAGLIISNAPGETWTRPGGTPKVFEDYVLLPIQVTRSGVYGERAYLYKLGNFSESSCIATNLGILVESGMDGDWTDKSMHHVSYADYIRGKIYAVDGQFSDGEYAIGLFEEV